ERCMDRVAGDGEARATDIVLTQVGQDAQELRAQSLVRPRHRTAGRARLPYAEQPHPVETHSRDAVQLGVRHVVGRGLAPQWPRQLAEVDASVDLIEG